MDRVSNPVCLCHCHCDAHLSQYVVQEESEITEMKVAFLDRDGTIIRDYPDEFWPSVAEPEFINGSIRGLRRLHDLGFQLIVITNQYLIGEGYITQMQYDLFDGLFQTKLAEYDVHLLDVFYCPHARSENCHCRKPATGMIEKAIQKYPSIELSKSILIGNEFSDLVLGKRMNISTYIIGEQNSDVGGKVRFVNSFDDVLKELL